MGGEERWRSVTYTLSGVRGRAGRAAAEQRGACVWGCVMAWRDGMREREVVLGGRNVN